LNELGGTLKRRGPWENFLDGLVYIAMNVVAVAVVVVLVVIVAAAVVVIV